MTGFLIKKLLLFGFILPALCVFVFGQPPVNKGDNRVRTVTIPISILSREELKNRQPQEFLEAGDLSVREDGDEQTILSIRDVSTAPLALGILVQDDLSSSFNLEIERLSEFIRRLPRGSRVMIAYLRGGSIQIRQKFTEDLEKASNSLRIVAGGSGGSSSSPYQGVSDALQRFDALPAGRRALLLISDGLDVSQGSDPGSIIRNSILEGAILKAQRKSVAVYSFYTSTALTEHGSSVLVLAAQSALERLSDETGGQAFFQGSHTPVSFDPFFRDLNLALGRQFALTYLSTHMNRGYHKVQVNSNNPQIKIEHPKGYYHR